MDFPHPSVKKKIITSSNNNIDGNNNFGCFNIVKFDIHNAISKCDPQNSSIDECKRLIRCNDQTINSCFNMINCSSDDFQMGRCIRKCDTQRDNVCYLRNKCIHKEKKIMHFVLQNKKKLQN